MNTRNVVLSVFALAALAGMLCGPVLGDPLPGEILKFQQLPLNNGATPYFPPPPAGTVPGAPYYGHDELSTATRTAPNIPWQGVYMADDFADKFTTPVVHIRWWGSYLHDDHGNPEFPFVKQFLISFEKDVPAGAIDPSNPTAPPLSYSHPGDPLLTQIVDRGLLFPGSGTFTEKLIPTPIMDGTPPMLPLEGLWEYNAELNLGKEFQEHPDTVYWLKIVALVDAQRDGPIQWGWHDRDWSIPDPLASTPPGVVPGEHIVPSAAPIIDPVKEFTSPVWHFQDDAVSGDIVVFPDPTMPKMPEIEQSLGTPQKYIFPWDGPESIQQYSKDLAFELYTRNNVPEPGTMGLMAMAAVALCATRRRNIGC